MAYYSAAKVEGTTYGVPISKYYPNISLDNIAIGETITLNCDIGKYKKGDIIKDDNKVKSLIIELIKTIQSMNDKINQMQTTIDHQQETIQELIDNPGSGSITWPDISNIDGGSSEDSGENGGTDEIQIQK